MLRTVQSLTGNKVHAADGDLGTVEEFYFDDQTWTIRYMVMNTGNWLSGRKVLISPVALGTPDRLSKTLPVNLTMDQIRNSPDIDTEQTVSRHHEAELSQYYAWPTYWGSGFGVGGLYGMTPLPPIINERTMANIEASAHARQGDPHLRSTRNIAGYHIHATDGEIGQVKDYIVDDERWTIRFLIVDTGNWLPGKKVFLSPHWVTRVDWDDSSVSVDLSRDSIKQNPEFDPSQLTTMGYESTLNDHDIYDIRPKDHISFKHASLATSPASSWADTVVTIRMIDRFRPL
jgi:uncharacterized protein YrrD